MLFVGRLAPEKNLRTLVTALEKLLGRLDVELAVVGDGPLRDHVRDTAARRGVPLGLLGMVDHTRLPAIYTDADVFVLPSFTEGHPKVLLEAMSAGVPCVASDVPANRSILDNGAAGLLFDPSDADALAGALERVLADGELARELGALAETITVAGDSPVVDVTTATLSEVVDSKRIVERAYWLVVGRPPGSQERALAAAFLKEQPLKEFALALFNLNAFLYVQ